MDEILVVGGLGPPDGVWLVGAREVVVEFPVPVLDEAEDEELELSPFEMGVVGEFPVAILDR